MKNTEGLMNSAPSVPVRWPPLGCTLLGSALAYKVSVNATFAILAHILRICSTKGQVGLGSPVWATHTCRYLAGLAI